MDGEGESRDSETYINDMMVRWGGRYALGRGRAHARLEFPGLCMCSVLGLGLSFVLYKHETTSILGARGILCSKRRR